MVRCVVVLFRHDTKEVDVTDTRTMLDPSGSLGIDWDAVTRETVETLCELIRFKTVNPPGEERRCAEWLAHLHKKEGILTRVYHTGLNRSNVVSRIHGTCEKPPVLLHGHLDVVPVELDKWTVDPFAGVIKDGYVWGRGAVDMKNMVAMCSMMLRLFTRLGLRPKREIIFAGVADEEAGGRYGAEWLVDHAPREVMAEYAIGEMGGFSVELSGKRFYLVQVAEKGVCWFRMHTDGKPGHGSIPDPHSAAIKAANAIAALGSTRLPYHATDPAKAFINGLADGLGFGKGTVMRGMLSPTLEPLVYRFLSGKDPDAAYALSAVLRNTVSPTVMRSGEKVNVIPSSATVECDGRLYPGCTKEEFLAEVRTVIGDGPEIEVFQHRPGASAPIDDPIMTIMTEALLARDPDAIVVPNLLSGVTDASIWQRLGMKCYGFSPLRMPADLKFKDLVHGHDERVPIDGIAFGLRALFDALYRLVM